MNILQRLENVFRSIFEINDLKILPEYDSSDIQGWNSLSHVKLIMAIEDEFSFRFKKADLENLVTIEDIVKIIEERANVET